MYNQNQSFSHMDSENRLKSETLWEIQLAEDFDRFNWQYRAKLNRPLIRVVDVDSYLGQWDPLIREIKISRKLILKRKWNVVLGILKHEMAHQYVNDIFKVQESHGAHFQKACDILGVEEVFRKSSSELESIITERYTEKSSVLCGQLTDDADEDAQRLFNKVEKLLSLAQSSNEHEATLAMEKVNELLEKHNLSKYYQNNSSAYQNKNSTKYTYIIIEFGKQKVSAAQSLIASLLIEHFFVKVIFSQLYEPNINVQNKTMEIIGTYENVKMAEYVYYFLLNQIENLWLNKKSGNFKGSHKRSYQLGLLHGFRQKLIDSKNERQKNERAEDKIERSRALVKICENSELSSYIDKRFPRLSARSSNSARVYGDAFSSGKEDGKSIVLNKGISKTHSGETLRLR